jgi:hypothetical protein
LLAQSTEVGDDKIYDSSGLGSWHGFWVKITTELGDRAVNKMKNDDKEIRFWACISWILSGLRGEVDDEVMNDLVRFWDEKVSWSVRDQFQAKLAHLSIWLLKSRQTIVMKLTANWVDKSELSLNVEHLNLLSNF